MRIRLALLGLLLFIGQGAHTPANATCTLPYSLTNGTTADANQVTANFNAVIACLGSTTSGFVNKFRNGTMDIAQRGAGSMTISTTGCTSTSSLAGCTDLDGWGIIPSGANVAASQASGCIPAVYGCLKVTGASGTTDIMIKQRIESYIAAPLNSQTVTVQCQAYQNGSGGGSITPTLTVKHAGSQDTWSSTPTIDVNAVSLQPMSYQTWTTLAYTFSASAASSNGLEVGFDFGNNFSSSSSYVEIAACDIRATPGVSTGLNSTPPPPELRPIGIELAFCQRYFETSYDNGVAPGTINTNAGANLVIGYSSGGSYVGNTVGFKASMRADPTMTITLYSPHSGTSGKAYDYDNSVDVTPALNTVTGEGSFNWYAAPSTGTLAILGVHWTASAEL